MHLFHLESQSWSEHAKRLPYNTAYHNVAKLRGYRILLLGGETESNFMGFTSIRLSDAVHYLDFAAAGGDGDGDWVPMAPMSSPRCTGGRIHNHS